MLDVERWAELRREHFVGGVSIKELVRRHGIDRNTVRRALRSDVPPVYRRASGASKLDLSSAIEKCRLIAIEKCRLVAVVRSGLERRAPAL